MVFKKSGSLQILVILVCLRTFEYRNITSTATQILNVRNTHKIQTRSLIYPPTAPTRLQFIGGIGIPVEDLHFESVTSGFVLKAEYFLPENADEYRHKVRPQTINRRRKSINETYYLNTSDNDHNNGWPLSEINNRTSIAKDSRKQYHPINNDSWKNKRNSGALYRWILYKAIEMVLDKSGSNGHVCVLRSICEHAAIPLNYKSGLLAEILHIILTPSTSRDDLVKLTHKDYIKAEVLGHSGDNCAIAFRECSKSPMDFISAVFEY